MNLKETSARNLIRIKHISQPISLDYLIESNLLKGNQTYVEVLVEKRMLKEILEKAVFSLPKNEKSYRTKIWSVRPYKNDEPRNLCGYRNPF